MYQVKVITGDRRGAGTDANVSVVIYGDKGYSGQPKILQTGANNFERGATDIFGVESSDLGELTKLRIGHDGTGFGSGWFLDKVSFHSCVIFCLSFLLGVCYKPHCQKRVGFLVWQVA